MHRWPRALAAHALAFGVVACQILVGVDSDRPLRATSSMDAAPDDGAADVPAEGAYVPSCASTESLCGNTCVDLLTNPSHCGVCDRACGKGCNGGLCEREVLTTLAAPAGCTYHYDQRIYLAEGTNIVSYRTDGSDRRLLGTVAVDRFRCHQLTVLAGRLFLSRWNDVGQPYSEVVRLNLDGTASRVMYSTTSAAAVAWQVVGADHEAFIVTRAGVWRFDPRADDAPNRISTHDGHTGVFIPFGDVAYFSGPGGSTTQLYRLPLAPVGLPSEVLRPPAPLTNATRLKDKAFLVGIDSLYSFDLETEQFGFAAGAFGPGATLRDVETDGTSLYISTSGDDSLNAAIVRFEPATRRRLKLASSGFKYMDITVDQKYVYFADEVPLPRLVRVPK